MKQIDPEDSPSPCRQAGRSLVGCPDCGRSVSPEARWCVHCGRPRPGGLGRLSKIVLGGVIAVVVVTLLFCRSNDPRHPVPSAETPVPAWEQAMRERPRGCGYLGVMLREPAEITFVAPDSPAERANLRPGDRIVAIDGRRVEQFRDYLRILWQKRPAERIRLSLARGRATTWTVDVFLDRHPKDE